MGLTEEDAKKMICPFREGGDYCLGSICMAWRLGGYRLTNTKGDEGEGPETEFTQTGYCGVAGRP